MTKIEAYKDAKRIAESIKSSAEYCLGRDSPSNDKHTFHCSFNGLANQTWTPMEFTIEASYGYYGRSAGYSATSEHLGRYLAKAINAHAARLLDYAVELAAKDAEKARKDAEEEARSVLQEAAPVKAAA